MPWGRLLPTSSNEAVGDARSGCRITPTIENLKERGARNDAEANHRTKLTRAFKGVFEATRRLRRDLSDLRSLEQARPLNQPGTRECFNAVFAGSPQPSPVLSEAGQDLRTAEYLISLAVAKLEVLGNSMRNTRGRRRDAKIRAVQDALKNAGLGDTKTARILQYEGLEGAGDARQRVRSRRRRAKV